MSNERDLKTEMIGCINAYNTACEQIKIGFISQMSELIKATFGEIETFKSQINILQNELLKNNEESSKKVVKEG